MAGATVAKAWAEHTLSSTVRGLRPRMASLDDPHAELMAMVWGPRFDRAHAVDLLMQDSNADPDLLISVTTAADCFDGLQAHRKERLRRLIMAHRERQGHQRSAVDNTGHAENSAH